MVGAKKQKVLLVEDDPALRRLVNGYLVRMGLEVVEASDGRAAIEALRGFMPDLVCLDLMLPEISGYDVCEAIRKNPALRAVPILMISARSLPEDRAQAEEVGATAYLIKPFSRVEFSNNVRALLQEGRPV